VCLGINWARRACDWLHTALQNFFWERLLCRWGPVSDRSLRSWPSTALSTIGLYQEVDLLQPVNATILIAPPTLFQLQAISSLDSSKSGSSAASTRRYNTDSTIVVLLGVTSKGCEVYKMSGEMFHLNSLLLEPKPYILNIEQVCFLPKPPWSSLCLVDYSSNHMGVLIPLNDKLLNTIDWHSITCGKIDAKLRPFWSLPLKLQIQSDDFQIRPTPWTSFIFLLAVQQGEGLSNNWHMIQFLKLAHAEIFVYYHYWLIPIKISCTVWAAILIGQPSGSKLPLHIGKTSCHQCVLRRQQKYTYLVLSNEHSVQHTLDSILWFGMWSA
jgi:hypothetical protein